MADYVEYELRYLNRKFTVLVEDIESFGESSPLHNSLDAAFFAEGRVAHVYVGNTPHQGDGTVGFDVLKRKEVDVRVSRREAD
ncbi:MAG: hypothetical protein ABL932_15775 [Terricaulis sp.]